MKEFGLKRDVLGDATFTSPVKGETLSQAICLIAMTRNIQTKEIKTQLTPSLCFVDVKVYDEQAVEYIKKNLLLLGWQEV